MPVPFIRCRNKVTEAEADLPETALPNMTNWVPIAAEPTETAWSAPADPKALDEPPAPAEAKSATASTTKSKAAPTAANEKE